MIAALVARLERGWQMISRETDPARRRQLEDHWITLLRTYERACDAMRAGDALEVA